MRRSMRGVSWAKPAPLLQPHAGWVSARRVKANVEKNRILDFKEAELFMRFLEHIYVD